MTAPDRLGERLAALGLRPVARIRVTDNRCVLVSLSRHRVLSLHRAFVDAPDDVLRAIVQFVARGAKREQRLDAQRTILAQHSEWAAHAPTLPRSHAPTRRPERQRPGDSEALERLALLFSDYNLRHFLGLLPTVPIRLSGRMRTRLGHLLLDAAGQPTEITISRRHLAKHGWDEVAHTLLHEMVHLWQCASGHAVDHGPVFRAKARATGVTAAARRWVKGGPRKRAHGGTDARTHGGTDARGHGSTHDAPRTTHYAPLTLF